MSPRGGDRGGRRPLKTEGDPRLSFTCRIKESNKNWIKSESERTGWSIGELADLAVEILQKHPEELPPDAETEDTEEE